MDPSDAIMNETVEHWLDQWERWLHLWLECGATTPGPLAKQGLGRKRRHQRMAGIQGAD